MRQFPQQILPAGLPPTTVWGYGAVDGAEQEGLLLHNAPSLTIEAKWNRPVRVKWINDLMDANGNYLPHLLPVDPTLHWANPPGGSDGPRHAADVHSTPGPYTGPVPIVTHVHGAVASATRATAMPRPGTCRRPPTSRPAMPPRAPGTTSSPARRRQVRCHLGARLRHLPVPEPQPRLDDLVPRPRPGHDPPERVRRSGRLLHHPRRPGWRRRRARQPLRDTARAARPRAQGGRQVPAQQDLLRDPDRDPGPLVQRRRLAVLPGHARVLRRGHRTLTSRTRTSRRSGTRSSSAT